MKVEAPFTDLQVLYLNEFQANDMHHAFTCSNESVHTGDGKLVATPEGWVCKECSYTQDWAHDFMTRPLPVSKFQEFLEQKNSTAMNTSITKDMDKRDDDKPSAGIVLPDNS